MTTTTHTFIARHSRKQVERSGCTRKAYRFEAPFVIDFTRCPDCGEIMPKRDNIRGIVRDDKECNARCMGAVGGGICECSCGGENHGGAYA